MIADARQFRSPPVHDTETLRDWSEEQRLIERCDPPESEGRGSSGALQKLALFVLRGFGERCFPTLATFAERMRLSEKSARAVLRALEEWGAVRRVERIREDGSQASNRYFIDYDALATRQLPPARGRTERPWEDGTPGVGTPPAASPPLSLPSNHPSENHCAAASPSRPRRRTARTEDPGQGRLIPNEQGPSEAQNPPAAPATPRRAAQPPAGASDRPGDGLNAASVRKAFQAAYEARYGVAPKWGGRQAKVAAGVLSQLRTTAQAMRPPGDVAALLDRVLAAYLRVEEPFVKGQSHAFEYIENRVPALLQGVAPRRGPAPTTGNKQGRWI